MHNMDRIMGVSLMFFLLFFCKGITGQLMRYTIDVASSVRVQEGLCVTIPCNFTADGRNTFRNSSGYWKYLNSFSTVATNDKSSAGRKPNFHLMGNPDFGDCTLTITDARREDEGVYFFRFEDYKAGGVRFSYFTKVTNISVTDLTEEPVISDLGKVIADDHQGTITCQMTNSKGKTTQKIFLLDVYSESIAFKEETNVCITRTMDSTIIIGMVFGNIAALVLINVGSYFFLKRRMEKRQLGKIITDPGKQGTESTYQELKKRDNDVYYNLKAQ
ncbi:sialic acid-binding Ig-like lectin 12 isoform X4 [Bufo gargarizans]|uniref:sialic acid-binding Ig-like lectin 12 isoform X4 n=1 Tax=Bufo gargarizans TaxID=30331 RepID=UPI001CF5572B|nr:sialic acid-binding Ig-like lectin 12 isoform X4 [Bufo gargarizans]